MDEIKIGGVKVAMEDEGDGMQCNEHQYKNNPGGICAVCLQEKLGKLVSSSFPLQLRASSSSSTSPSVRSDGVSGNNNSSVALRPSAMKDHQTRRVRIPFVLSKKSKKTMAAESSGEDMFKRSKSTNTTRGRRNRHFLDGAYQDYTPRKRGFWSFLHMSSSKSNPKPVTLKVAGNSAKTMTVEEKDEEGLPDRKVSRSRSLGCGSRSFSGDFFERISTGFGDCTLRRVESHREGKPRNMERARCGGIFGGFIVTSSSSSYLVSSTNEIGGKPTSGGEPHGRVRSWGWAFSNPRKTIANPGNSKGGKRDAENDGIPSILPVKS